MRRRLSGIILFTMVGVLDCISGFSCRNREFAGEPILTLGSIGQWRGNRDVARIPFGRLISTSHLKLAAVGVVDTCNACGESLTIPYPGWR